MSESKKFRVLVAQCFTHYGTIEVEAESPDDAMDKASIALKDIVFDEACPDSDEEIIDAWEV